MRVIQKIGSDSAFGQVFKVAFITSDESEGPESGEGFLSEKDFMATKVMPDVGPYTSDNNFNEWRITSSASDLVRAGRSIYFPILYGEKECHDMRLTPPPTDAKERSNLPGMVQLYTRSQEWAIKKSLIDRYITFEDDEHRKRELKMLDRLDLYTIAGHIFEHQRNLEEDAHVMVDMTTPLSGLILFTELAWGDMRQFLRIVYKARYGDSESIALLPLDVVDDLIQTNGHAIMLQRVFQHVMYAIRDMHRLLHISHNDLHIGNVLIQFVRGAEDRLKPLALVTDFGHARAYKKGRELDDALNFIRFVIERSGSYIPSSVLTKLTNMRHELMKKKKSSIKTIDQLIAKFETRSDPMRWL
jgi:hypothetical protein